MWPQVQHSPGHISNPWDGQVDTQVVTREPRKFRNKTSPISEFWNTAPNPKQDYHEEKGLYLQKARSVCPWGTKGSWLSTPTPKAGSEMALGEREDSCKAWVIAAWKPRAEQGGGPGRRGGCRVSGVGGIIRSRDLWAETETCLPRLAPSSFPASRPDNCKQNRQGPGQHYHPFV